MRNRLAITKSVAALQVAYEQLAERAAGIPGMALVYGYTGAGKTTAIAWLRNRTDGVYVRALRAWTLNTMLGRIVTELGGEGGGRSAAMVDWIASRLLQTQRPLFVDEADYLLADAAMIETLRDIHDVSGTPVVLVGMEGIERRLKRRPQLERRLGHWVEFLPSDLEDAAALARAVCEVEIADDLLRQLHDAAKGSVGKMMVGLARIEAFARANGRTAMDADAWGPRRLFLGDDARSAQ